MGGGGGGGEKVFLPYTFFFSKMFLGFWNALVICWGGFWGVWGAGGRAGSENDTLLPMTMTRDRPKFWNGPAWQSNVIIRKPWRRKKKNKNKESDKTIGHSRRGMPNNNSMLSNYHHARLADGRSRTWTRTRNGCQALSQMWMFCLIVCPHTDTHAHTSTAHVLFVICTQYL